MLWQFFEFVKMLLIGNTFDFKIDEAKKAQILAELESSPANDEAGEGDEEGDDDEYEQEYEAFENKWMTCLGYGGNNSAEEEGEDEVAPAGRSRPRDGATASKRQRSPHANAGRGDQRGDSV